MQPGGSAQPHTSVSIRRRRSFIPGEVMSTYTSSTNPIRRLTRLEQLTLNTWRWAAVSLRSTLDPSAVLELAALHAVLASLRDLGDPVELFTRHSQAQPEFNLVRSVLPDDRDPGLAQDI